MLLEEDMELQKPFRRQFLGAWILWIMQYFSKLMKDDPQWNVKLYSENEFENVIKVVRGEKWQFYMCCILPLFSPAKLGGESDQEEKLAATLDKTFFQLQTFAKMFLSLIHTSYKKLTTILQVTYRLDTPNDQSFPRPASPLPAPPQPAAFLLPINKHFHATAV